MDPAGRTVSVLGFGDRGREIVADWLAATPAGRVVWSLVAERADDATLAALAGQVRAARVGWRLMLSGPEVDVLAARAVATGLGLLDAEIRAAVTGADRKRVHCAHCRVTTEAEVPVGAEVPCRGCARRLHVYAHVARRTGAYLGFMADAEEVA
ncbi:dimethylamine monooxygenase subunit DmmA family protein [Geodermatophilus sp. SYSU D00804]